MLRVPACTLTNGQKWCLARHKPMFSHFQIILQGKGTTQQLSFTSFFLASPDVMADTGLRDPL